MVLKSYLIGPQQEGWANRVEPFYLPENAFYELEDAYVWRGRVKKRFGYSLIGATDLDSRLRILLGQIDFKGALIGTVPGNIFKVGQMFSVGTDVLTVVATAFPFVLLTTNGTFTGTFNIVTGAFSILGTPATDVYFYPAEPVMGLRGRELSAINAEDVIAFDTQFAYERVLGAWERISLVPATDAAQWTGSNSQFYWTVNYRGANPEDLYFYEVNNKAFDGGTRTLDGIKYLLPGGVTWTNLRPQLSVGPPQRMLEGARIILGFKDRLVVLNTIESSAGTDANYYNRVRFSQNGNPLQADAWDDVTPGKGGYIDAPIEQQIVSAERLRDRLIVYFERSTWELVYTGNESAPFKWQQLNDELGCESSFSVIGFDRNVLGVGNVGIHDCNGVNVGRIDEKIPSEVFNIHNGNDGPARVYGIRDYYNELVYWTLPDTDAEPTFPTRVLLYNYENSTWALLNDSFTCFGYFQKRDDITWDDLGAKFGDWKGWDVPWGSPFFQSDFPDIIAGNQEGFVHIIETGRASNAQSLYITDMDTAAQELTIIDHNLKTGDFVYVEDLNGVALDDPTITTFKVVVIDKNTIRPDFPVSPGFSWTGVYTGGGKVGRISNIKIVSKEFNPGTPVGQQFSMPYVDFLLSKTSDGEVSLDYYIDTSNSESINDNAAPGALLGSNILYTQPEDSVNSFLTQQQLWHRYFIQSQGAFIQLRFSLSDSQMLDLLISQSPFELHAILLYVEPQGRITGP